MFINSTEVIGVILATGTTTLTGSITVTLLMILAILMVIAIMFGIPLEFLSILILPLCISVGAYYSDFLTPLIVIIIYVSTIIAKNWLFR